MSEPAIFFTEVNERQGAFTRRAFVFGVTTGLGLVGLGARLLYLQSLEADRYVQLSDSNQFNTRLITPPRGLILDRHGTLIATNRPSFRLVLARDESQDTERTLADLQQLVALTPERTERLRKDIANAPRRAPVTILEDMSWEEFARVSVRAPELPGVTADVGEVRVYPFAGAFAHVVGYVAKVSEMDVKRAGPKPDPLLLNPGFRIGKQGVEKRFDQVLRGRPGTRKVEVDAAGRLMRSNTRADVPPKPGEEIRLTLDADVQNRALAVFGEDSGAAVVMDCRTGDLLCLVSAPSFDANRFVRGLTGPEYRALAGYERKPLLDKSLTGTYPPGSTFKTMTALAALEAGVDPTQKITCNGGWEWGGRRWACWRKEGHGHQDMHDAIKNSCDVFFYQTALRIGPDRIAGVAEAMGLGQVFDIGISGQRKGIVPSTAWKKKRFAKDPRNQTWFPGESPSFGIGQGYLEVNALQLAVMTARLANGKVALNPRLLKSVAGVETPSGAAASPLPFDPAHIAFVRAGMAAVANDVTGTAYKASQLGLGPIMMAGKTGTAQVRSYDKVKSRSSVGIPWRLRDHGLFVAFAPYDDPRYALSIVVEHGIGGAKVAAPKAREIMRMVLLKDPQIRARIEQPQALPDIGNEGDEEGAAPPAPQSVTSNAAGVEH